MNICSIKAREYITECSSIKIPKAILKRDAHILWGAGKRSAWKHCAHTQILLTNTCTRTDKNTWNEDEGYKCERVNQNRQVLNYINYYKWGNMT